MAKNTFFMVVSLCCSLMFFCVSMEVAADEGASQKDIDSIVKALKGVQFEGLMYLSYQAGESGNVDYNAFALKRGYFGIKKSIIPWFSARLTTDIHQDDDGSTRSRIKYMYGQFHIHSNSVLTKPNIEVGQVHMPWLDFEEHTDYFRLQDPMFIERNEILNSADVGITFASLLGGNMDTDYQNKVNSQYPGRYGSVSFGIYNGGGYHAKEMNKNKVFMGRLTIRPIPDVIPGLQFSYFGTIGKGNKDTKPDWNTNLGFVSFEQQYITLTGSYYVGTGNQGGADENDRDGSSVFAEIKPNSKFSIIGRYDLFDPNSNVDNDENIRIIAGAAYMLDKPHKNMILLDFENVSYEEANKPDYKRLQLTLQVSL